MNNDNFELILQGVSTVFINLLIFLFLFRVYTPKYSSKLLYIALFMVTSLIYVLINQLARYLNLAIINTVFLFIYTNILSILLFRCTIKKAMLYNSLFVVILVFVDVFVVAFWFILRKLGIKNVLSGLQYQIIDYYAIIMISFFATHIYTVILRKNDLIIIKNKQMILIGLITLFSSFVEYNFTIRIHNSSDALITIILVVGFLLLNMYVVHFTEEIAKAYNSKSELMLMQKQNTLQLEHYNKLNKKYEESRKVIHDIRKHLSVINLLNDSDNIQAQEYGKVVEKQLGSLFTGFQCSNKILSIIMGQKINEAEKLGIKITTKIEDMTLSFLDDIDITAIFANLWDNAIEACKDIDETKRFVSIIIGQVNEFVVVCFENSFDGQIRKRNDTLLSTKEKHEGIGISIIKVAVEKYNGFINFEHDFDTFKVKLMIPVA